MLLPQPTESTKSILSAKLKPLCWRVVCVCVLPQSVPAIIQCTRQLSLTHSQSNTMNEAYNGKMAKLKKMTKKKPKQKQYQTRKRREKKVPQKHSTKERREKQYKYLFCNEKKLVFMPKKMVTCVTSFQYRKMHVLRRYTEEYRGDGVRGMECSSKENTSKWTEWVQLNGNIKRKSTKANWANNKKSCDSAKFPFQHSQHTIASWLFALSLFISLILAFSFSRPSTAATQYILFINNFSNEQQKP